MLLSGVPSLAAKAVEFSSLNTTSERSAALAAFTNGEAKLLVASDAMTRGMDLPSVAAVVNYDAPVYPKTYVHRAGRTARAGRAGKQTTCPPNCQQTLQARPWSTVGCSSRTRDRQDRAALEGQISSCTCSTCTAVCLYAFRCSAVGAGRVYTILRKEEVRHFKELLRKVNNTFVMDHKLAPRLLEAAQPACSHALEVLQAYLAAEGS